MYLQYTKWRGILVSEDYQSNKQSNWKVCRWPEQTPLPKDIQMANWYMKRCWTSLAVTEVQIKTITRCHLIPIRMAIINKASNKHRRVCGETKNTPNHCWWVESPWKTNMACLQNIKNRVTIWPSNPSSGSLPKNFKTMYLQRHMHPYPSLQHCSRWPGHRHNPSVLRQRIA